MYRKFTNLSLLYFISALIFQCAAFDKASAQSYNAKDRVVFLSAEVKNLPPSITINWVKTPYATNYELIRMNPEVYLGLFDSTKTSFTDTNVVAGQAYEYSVMAKCSRVFNDTTLFEYKATGYIYTGVEVAAVPTYGTVLVLIDSLLSDPLSAEIKTLTDDLILEGWNVVKRDVSRAEQFDKNKVKATKKVITDVKKDNKDLSTVIILGRVAVPYSGNNNPDGHGDHKGAWPADMYYSSLDEGIWTDDQVNNITASREENRNIPGDGKFDQSVLPQYYDLQLAVGRVDFFNMPSFYDKSLSAPEVELYRQYLNKNHDYRSGKTEYQMKALVDDNFGGMQETFATSGWRNYATFIKYDDIQALDFITTLNKENYMFAYGCGGGTYQSAGGIGNSVQMNAGPINANFTLLFGSYFGDWDSQDNFLRSPLAAKGTALTCAWAGRPHLFFHKMALGEPIGFSMMLSAMNTNQYIPNVEINKISYPNGIIYATGMRGVHTALMGDPTLRLFKPQISNVVPLISFTVTELGKGKIKLQWTKNPASTDSLYSIYRATKPEGPWTLVNKTPSSALEYIDNFLFDGTIYYIITPISLRTSNSGTYYTSGRGLFGEVMTTGIEDNATATSIKISPNPAVSYAEIKVRNSGYGLCEVSVCDAGGRTVANLLAEEVTSGEQFIRWNLTDNSGIALPSGVYMIKIKSGTMLEMRKIIINR